MERVKKYSIGIDEVGRGPLAGPVTVSAFCILDQKKFVMRTRGFFLRDSKKLSESQRKKWVVCVKEFQKEKICMFTVVSVPPKTIDAINISAAANRAATQALKKLLHGAKLKSKQVRVLCDAGIHPEKKFLTEQHLSYQSIVKGDEKIPVISLASIVAKVYRDTFMHTLERRFPGYGFGKHKGYGTEFHRTMIKKMGASPAHRLTFIRNFTRMNV